MKSYDVKYTNQVLQQVDGLIGYVLEKLQSVHFANDLLDALESAMQSLGEMPKRHQLVNDEPWHTEGIRKFVIRVLM